jgi:hypothetical protein
MKTKHVEAVGSVWRRYGALRRGIPVIVAFAVAAPLAHAGPQQGVYCPSGFSALISNGNKHLICRKVIPYERDAICLPAYKLVNNGSALDMCEMIVPSTNVVSRLAPTAVPIVPTPGQVVVEDLTQQVNPNGLDKFVATVHEFSFPKGRSLPYIGDASRGVECPEGFDGDKTHNDRGIRCDKYDGSPRSADCDGIVGWEWRKDFSGAEDRCRNIVTGATGPTKPEGMTKVQHDLERSSNEIGWILNEKSGARDTWQRKVYKFPIN